jgi:uncharacterized membrane protein
LNEDRKYTPEELQDLFDSELAIRRETSAETRRKANFWAMGAGMACGHFASLVPRLPDNATVRPFLFTDQKWEVVMLLGGLASLAIFAALAGFLLDRTQTSFRDFSLAGLAVALMEVLLR